MLRLVFRFIPSAAAFLASFSARVQCFPLPASITSELTAFVGIHRYTILIGEFFTRSRHARITK